MEAPSRSRRRLYRWILAGVAMSIVTIYLRWRYWPYYEAGSGAMAPAFLGPHVIAACGNCGFELALGIPDDPSQHRQDSPRTVPCPNCAAACSVPPPGEAERGDMLALRHMARPERRDVVAYRTTSTSKTIHLSRVIGLPGESIEIRAGDVYVDGARLTRRPDEVGALWQLVHDAAHLPKAPQKGGPAWLPAAGSAWRLVGEQWGIEKAAEEPARLEFRGSILSGVPYASLYQPAGPHPWRDAPVGDVRLTVRLRQFTGPGRLRLVWQRGDLEVHATVKADGDVTLRAPAAGVRGRVIPLMGAPSLQLAILDGRAYFGAGEAPAVEVEIPVREDLQGTACHLALEATSCALEIACLRIERDVHYLRKPFGEPARAGPVSVGAGEYYLLGDNSPNSADSRWFGPVPAANILGVAHNLAR